MESAAHTVIAYPIDAVPAIAGVTRTQVFAAIRAQKLMARKLGRRTLVEADEVRRWISTLPTRGRESEPKNTAA
jgi:hypothetical protein